MKLSSFLPYIFLLTSLFADAPPPGFKAIFNGKDLTDWNGEPGRWTVEEEGKVSVPVAAWLLHARCCAQPLLR